MSTTLGERIRELRLLRSATLAYVAAEAGISTSYLNDIEHDRTVPTLGRLVAIAGVFGYSARELLDGIPPYDITPRSS